MYLKNKKNICFINSCITWGGGEKWHFEVAKILFEKGYNVILITNTKSELAKKISKTQISHYPIKIGNISFLNIFKILKIKNILKKHSIETVIFGLPSDVKIGSISAKLAHVKNIIYRRGTALTVKNSILNQILYKKFVTSIIVNSLEIQKKLLEKNPTLFPTDKIHVIYNGVKFNENEQIIETTYVKNNKLIIGTAGRIVEQKGHYHLIYLAKELLNYNIDFEIQIAGKGILKKTLLKLAEQLGVSKYIKFLDFIEDINNFYNTLNIFVLTSSHEGSANTIIEAMYYAKPIITFNISSLPEIIEDKKNGFLIEYGNIKKMAECIIYLTQNPHIISEIGLAARQKVYMNNNIDNIILQLESII